MNCGATDGITYLPFAEHSFVGDICTGCGIAKIELTTIKSDGTNNALITQENGLYSYTFASDGDYVRNDCITLEKGDTLVCDWTMTLDVIAESGWFGVAFGDGTDVTKYPNTMFGMRYYSHDSIKYKDSVDVKDYDASKTIYDMLNVNGQATNYRVTLTYNEDGTYSYRFMRTDNDGNYSVVDEYLNIDCPSPTSLYLLTAYNPTESTHLNNFTMTDLSFYKLG